MLVIPALADENAVYNSAMIAADALYAANDAEPGDGLRQRSFEDEGGLPNAA